MGVHAATKDVAFAGDLSVVEEDCLSLTVLLRCEPQIEPTPGPNQWRAPASARGPRKCPMLHHAGQFPGYDVVDAAYWLRSRQQGYIPADQST
jgi:hypothetical protein